MLRVRISNVAAAVGKDAALYLYQDEEWVRMHGSMEEYSCPERLSLAQVTSKCYIFISVLHTKTSRQGFGYIVRSMPFHCTGWDLEIYNSPLYDNMAML